MKEGGSASKAGNGKSQVLWPKLITQTAVHSSEGERTKGNQQTVTGFAAAQCDHLGGLLCKALPRGFVHHRNANTESCLTAKTNYEAQGVMLTPPTQVEQMALDTINVFVKVRGLTLRPIK